MPIPLRRKGRSATLRRSVPSPASSSRSDRLTAWLTAAPAVGAVVVCCGLPLAWMAVALVANPDVWRELRVTPWRAGLMGRTLGYNGLAAVIATAMGLPAGLVLGRGRGAVVRGLWVVLPAALLMPSLSYAYGWSQVVRLARLWVADGSGWVWDHAHDGRPVGIGPWLVLLVSMSGTPLLFADVWRKRVRVLGTAAIATGCAAAALACFPTFRDPTARAVARGVFAATSRLYDGDRIPLPMIPGGTPDTVRCIWSLAAWLWAVPAAMVGLALRRMDTDVQQQAVLDGVLYRVTARQLLGTVVAAAAVVTVLATQEFAVYEPTGISVVATEVRMVFDTGSVSSPDNPIAATGMTGEGRSSPDQAARAAAAVATALPLVLATAALAVTAAWAAGRSGAADAVAVGRWPRVLDAPPWAVLLTLLLVAVNVGVPVLALVGSLKVSVWSSVTGAVAEFGPKVGGSVLLAGIATVVAATVAMSAAGRWTPGLLAGAAATFLVGGQLLAIAMIRIYNHPQLGLDRWAYDAWPVPAAMYVGRFAWLAVAGARVTWGGPWRAVRDMAAVDGAGPLATAAQVVWPLAWPTLAAGAVLVGALSLTEVPATVLLSPQNPQVLTPMLMTWLHMVRYDSMIRAALLMMAVVLGPAVLAVLLVGAGQRVARGRAVALLVVGLLLVVGSGCGRSSSEPSATWLDTGTGPGQVVYPRGLAYSPADDTIFVVDRMARVQHLDRDGKFLNAWDMPDRRSGKPVGLSVGPDGNVYVPDTHYYRIIVYTPLGKEVRRWGSFGRGPGQFVYPTDIQFDRQGRCFVAEYGDNDRIQVFSPEGKWLYQFGAFGQGDGQFIRPQDMVIDGDTLYVTDACNHRICVFTTDGKWVRNMGTCGSGPGQFRFPYGLDMDREGNLIVSEFGNNRVQRIDKATGRGLGTWGGAGRDPGQLAYPWGVIVDRRDRVVVSDAGNNRLQVLSF